MKKLSIDVVATVTNFLLLTFGKTTTLDVKGNLRRLGFEATQKEVSSLLEKYYDMFENDYQDYVIDGKKYNLTFSTAPSFGKVLSYRIYRFDLAPGQEPVISTKTTAAPTPVATPLKKQDPRTYISKNMNISAYTLAAHLGISKGSVIAYKANISRGN